MDPKRRGTPAYNRSYDSEYQRPRKFQRTNPYNQDQVNLCDVEKTLWRLYTRSFYTSIIMYVRKFPFYTMYLPDSNVTLPTSNPVCTASATSVYSSNSSTFIFIDPHCVRHRIFYGEPKDESTPCI